VTFFLGKPFSPDRASNLIRVMRGPMLTEKRRHARLPYRTRVECKWGALGEGQFVGTSVNIGEGGMLLEPSGGLEVGEQVRVEFSMPNHKNPLRPQARVVRREDPNRVAVEFVQISPEEQEAIRDYIFGRGKE
jgi:c-di-GMP-binding flagellar brake protein YcgR